MSFQTNGYFSISFADLIGFIVTIVSVILIVKQLNDSRLAVQVESFLTISDRFAEITRAIEFVDRLSVSEDWERFDNSEAYLYITKDKENKEFYMQVGAFYEVVSALLRRGALDKKLAVNTFGIFGALRYQTLEKAINHHRELVDEPALYEQWEWLAININSL